LNVLIIYSAVHDAFGLYGRSPLGGGYTWNPNDRNSMMCAYPVGPNEKVRCYVLLSILQSNLTSKLEIVFGT
jgi:hypothetical protein